MKPSTQVVHYFVAGKWTCEKLGQVRLDGDSYHHRDLEIKSLIHFLISLVCSTDLKIVY
jgi:hypothetical protein